MQKSQLPHVLTLILFESTPIGSQCYSQIVCIVCVCVYAWWEYCNQSNVAVDLFMAVFGI